MAARLAGPGAAISQVVRIRPGESDAIAAGLNPLEPAADGEGRRFPLQTHADLVKALFIASFRSDEPFPQVLSAALTRVYEDAGDDSDKAFLMGTVLIRLVEHLRMAHRADPTGSGGLGGVVPPQGGSGGMGPPGREGASRAGFPGLRHLTVIEEAHRLLRR